VSSGWRKFRIQALGGAGHTKEPKKKNLTQSRLRPVSPFSYVGQGRKDPPASLREARRKGSEKVMDRKGGHILLAIGYWLLAIREAGCFAVFIEQVDVWVTGGIYIETEAFFSLGIDKFEAMNGQMVSGVSGCHHPDDGSSERERKKDAGNDQET
jgi:hypothetical protein